jgi:CheY-like chemotaxis protein
MTNEPFRILLADDDEADRLLFKEAFEESLNKLD